MCRRRSRDRSHRGTMFSRRTRDASRDRTWRARRRRVHAARRRVQAALVAVRVQGLGEVALELLDEARRESGLPVVTEVMDTMHLESVARVADVIQIGARSMQNFVLLSEVGRLGKPVLLKRGLSSTIKELLMAAEYIAAAGNTQLILCERGIRTYEQATRDTLDVAAVPVLKAETHLPIIVDPKTGRWRPCRPRRSARFRGDSRRRRWPAGRGASESVGGQVRRRPVAHARGVRGAHAPTRAVRDGCRSLTRRGRARRSCTSRAAAAS